MGARAAWETRELGGVTTHVYTPASSSPIGDGRALMVVLHGCSQLASTLRDHGNFESAAESFGMVIAVPAVPGGGVLAGCWNYYLGVADAEAEAVIALTEELQLDAGLGIDAAQVYVAGFSSGGGEAQVVACMDPERYAGVAVVAGPSLGTTSLEVFSVPAGLDAATVAQHCNDLAGPAATAFGTHLAITMSDSADFTVAQGYATLDAEMFATLYTEQGAVLSPSTEDLADADGSMPSGTAYLQSDAEGPRIARLETMGLGHFWPSGSGLDPSVFTFVTGDGIDFTRYAAQFFADHNRRVRDEDEGTGTGDDTGSGDDTSSGSGDGSPPTTETGLDEGTGSNGSGGTGDGGSTGGRPTGTGDDSTTGETAGAGDSSEPPSGCQCTALGSQPGDGTGWRGLGLLLGLGLGRLGLRRRRG